MALCDVLDVFGHGYPRMHPVLIDRERWCREVRRCESSYGNGNTVFSAFHDVVDRGAASRTEGELAPSTFVSNTDILRARSVDLDRLSRKPGLSPEDASGSALTCKAMADRHPDRFSKDSGRELAAATRRDSKCHGEVEEVVF